jgi:hypothetical protein
MFHRVDLFSIQRLPDSPRSPDPPRALLAKGDKMPYRCRDVATRRGRWRTGPGRGERANSATIRRARRLTIGATIDLRPPLHQDNPGSHHPRTHPRPHHEPRNQQAVRGGPPVPPAGPARRTPPDPQMPARRSHECWWLIRCAARPVLPWQMAAASARTELPSGPRRRWHRGQALPGATRGSG